MFYLYRKTHNKTGLMYLGYTKTDPFKYKGSGLYWKRHIKLYGNDVTTEILYESDDIDDISEIGKHYSKIWDVVNSTQYANLCEEDGNKLYGNANPNFRGHPHTTETKIKISENSARTHSGKYGVMHPSYGHQPQKNWQRDLEKAWNSTRGKPSWNSGVQIGPMSDDHKEKISQALSGVKKELLSCPYCGKVGGKPALVRWHFDNCKEKT